MKRDVTFYTTVSADLPEHMEVSFKTPGFTGGDDSGPHRLELTWGAGSYEIAVRETGVRIEARGDWELEGMLNAIIELGDRLRALRGLKADA